METPILVIFIDALPYGRAINLAKSLKAKTYSKSVPGVGYSINVKAEMFAGLRPDDVGYFCEWNYNPNHSVSWWTNKLMTVFDHFGRISTFADRVFHKLIAKAIGENVYAIPYRLLPLLKCSGLTAYEYKFSFPTFLSKGNFDRVLYSEEGVNDRKVFERALDRLSKEKNKRLFVSTAQLDGVMHRFGMSCKEYEDQIELIEEYTVRLVREFVDIHGEDARYFVFSDHGMAPVLEGVKLDIEEYCGAAGKDSYVYFIDATFFRVWLIDKSLKAKIVDIFTSLQGGHLLSAQERESFGIVDGKHGDLIFSLDESKQFAPNFFGPNICQAMHGYCPDLESQLGVFLSNLDGVHGEKISATSIFDAVSEVL